MVDDDLEAALDTTGWVVVPLLDADEVRDLVGFYRFHAEHGQLNPEGAYDPTYAEFSVIHSRPEFRRAAFTEIVRTVARRADPLLCSFRPLVANFVNKPPGTGVVPMHQNWTVVDEQRFRSVSVWVALVDCGLANGTLRLLPGSHRDFREPRGMWSYEAFADATDAIEPMLERVDVRAGDAIILDDATVHYSPPNTSATDRLAIQLIMVPDAATPMFWQQVGGDETSLVADAWEVEEPFFWDFWHGDGDTRYGRVTERRSLPAARLGEAEFRRRYVSGSS
jgi:hypothetical protein